jgi:hypothetical protein
MDGWMLMMAGKLFYHQMYHSVSVMLSVNSWIFTGLPAKMKSIASDSHGNSSHSHGISHSTIRNNRISKASQTVKELSQSLKNVTFLFSRQSLQNQIYSPLQKMSTIPTKSNPYYSSVTPYQR